MTSGWHHFYHIINLLLFFDPCVIHSFFELSVFLYLDEFFVFTASYSQKCSAVLNTIRKYKVSDWVSLIPGNIFKPETSRPALIFCQEYVKEKKEMTLQSPPPPPFMSFTRCSFEARLGACVGSQSAERKTFFFWWMRWVKIHLQILFHTVERIYFYIILIFWNLLLFLFTVCLALLHREALSSPVYAIQF